MSGDFWSRRRAAVAEEKREGDREAAEADAEAARRALEEKPDEEVLAELDLPDPDTLQEGDDFTAFMARAVPERLRRRALRRLWLSNPLLANLDELLDYGEDFTDAATVVADLQSVYRVGKGMVSDEDLARAAEAAADEDAKADEEAEGDAADPPPEDIADGAEAGDAAAVPETEPEDAPRAPPEEGPAPPGRRHMRFAFAAPGGDGTPG